MTRKPDHTSGAGSAGNAKADGDGKSSLDRLAEFTRRILQVPKTEVAKRERRRKRDRAKSHRANSPRR